MTQVLVAVAIVALAMVGLAAGLIAGRGPLKKRCALHGTPGSAAMRAQRPSPRCPSCGGERPDGSCEADRS